VAAASALSQEARQRFSGREGLFLIDFTGGATRYSEATASPEAPRATHPLLYNDPVSRKESLIVDSLFMDRIVGLDRDASEALRAEAHSYLYAPENIYRHDWTVGDLVVWNNVALQHSRPELPDRGERTHRRVSGTYQASTTDWEASFRDKLKAAG
jgi:taurine dioxygenase